MTGMASGIDVDAVVKELMSAQKLKKTNLEGKKEKLSWTQDKWKEMNTKLYSFYTDKISKMRLAGSYNSKKVTPSDATKVSATATTAVNGSYSLSIEKLASAEYVTGADVKDKNLSSESKLSDAGMAIGQTITIKTGKNQDKEFSFEVTADSTIKDFTDKLKEAGLNANFDSKNGRFFISAKDTGADNMFTIVSDATETGKGLDALGLTNIDLNVAKNGSVATDSSQVAIVGAQDAKIKLNGAIIESGSNSINVNGLSLELKGTTNEDGIQLNVTKDTQKVYDFVKDFVKGYNELMTEMYEKYNAPSARNYSMLTSEQKEAMMKMK
jgi:flagellar hook-associated protein 2